MIDPPKRIKIGYADFPIRFVDKVDDEDGRGESSFDEQYIKICNGLSHQQQALVLTHEVDHMLYDFGGLREGDDEERIVTVMSNMRAMVYRDNPQYLRYFISVFHPEIVSDK